MSGINPNAPSYVDSSINDECKARQSRESYKINKYHEYSSQNGKGFVPFVLESYGGLGDRAHKFLAKIVEEGDQSAPTLFDFFLLNDIAQVLGKFSIKSLFTKKKKKKQKKRALYKKPR